MARRATVIKQEREKTEGIILVLDAGSSLLGNQVSLVSEGRVLVEAMNAMGYDALALGDREFALGLDVLREREAEADFPFLSANLVNADDEALLFQPYIILERQGKSVGIIGLSEPEVAKNARVSKLVSALDPVETARQYVGELRGQVDVLIVLSHLGVEEDKALAKEVTGIDVIVGGKSRTLMREPARVGNTLIVQQGYDGEWMGRLRATFDAQGVPSDYAEKLYTLTADYKDDQEMLNLVNEYKKLVS